MSAFLCDTECKTLRRGKQASKEQEQKIDSTVATNGNHGVLSTEIMVICNIPHNIKHVFSGCVIILRSWKWEDDVVVMKDSISYRREYLFRHTRFFIKLDEEVWKYKGCRPLPFPALFFPPSQHLGLSRICLSIYLWFYSPLLGLGRFFSFLSFYTIGRIHFGRIPWRGCQPVARPLPAQDCTNIE
jgi:hypothetical protein